MFHLTWAGMLGRKKESSLLLIVLALSFLLSSALAIVLPSTQAGIQLQRQKTYGSWQLMLYSESDSVCDAMAQAAQARGAKSAFLPTVGVTSDNEIISEITPELMELSGFDLLEGRLPENKDEILIVENQFGIRSKPQVGEQISVQYFWDIYSTDADDYRRRQEQAFSEAMQETLSSLKENYLESYYQYIDGLLADNESSLWDYRYDNLTKYCLNTNENIPPEEMTEEQLNTSFLTYLSTYLWMSPLSPSDITVNEPKLYGRENFNMTVLKRIDKRALHGIGYGPLEGKIFSMNSDYLQMTANVHYTVCGILKAYEGTWDSGSHALPDAFLSAEGRQAIEDGVQYVKDDLPDLAMTSVATTTLLMKSEGSAAGFYTDMTEVYRSISEPTYRLDHSYDERWRTTTGIITGLIPGTDTRRSWEFSTNGDTVFIPDDLDEKNFTTGKGQSVSLSRITEPDFRIPGLDPLPVELPSLEELYQKNEYRFRLNAYAYPDEAGSAASATSAVLNGILVLISACAVLVICVVQSKRRAHGLVLLKSIGLQNGQAAVMQLTEALLFLVISLLIGLPLGYLAASLAMRWLYGGSVLAMDFAFLLRSVIFGALSLCIGLEIPLLYAMRLPLTGKSAIAVKKAPRRAGLRSGTLLDMERAAARFNRRRDLLARLLCSLALLLALLTLLLSHFAFDSYRIEVERADMPDYTLKAGYGMSSRFLREKQNKYEGESALGETPSRLESYLAAENIKPGGERAEESPLMQHLLSQNERIGVVGLSANSTILQRLLALTGPIDTEKLLSGKGCILLMPYYSVDKNEDYSYSADPADAYRYETDDTFRPGDKLRLTAVTHSVAEPKKPSDVPTLEKPKDITKEMDVEVLAVLHEYPGVWLLGGSAVPCTVVSGQKLITNLYPYASQRCNADEARWLRQLSALHCEYCRGTTYFQFYASDAEDHTSSYWNLAQSDGLDMKNYYREKLERRSACLNQQVMTVLLGAAATLLVVIILLFIHSDMAEQERRRIGILRALGASKKAIRKTHWLLAMQEGLWAVLLANAAIAVVLVCCAFFETGFHTLSPAALITTLSQGLLWQYPWLWHLAICVIAWGLITLLRVLPYQRLCKLSVIGTIKGLERGE